MNKFYFINVYTHINIAIGVKFIYQAFTILCSFLSISIFSLSCLSFLHLACILAPLLFASIYQNIVAANIYNIHENIQSNMREMCCRYTGF